jgi:hypothetical protein
MRASGYPFGHNLEPQLGATTMHSPFWIRGPFRQVIPWSLAATTPQPSSICLRLNMPLALNSFANCENCWSRNGRRRVSAL